MRLPRQHLTLSLFGIAKSLLYTILGLALFEELYITLWAIPIWSEGVSGLYLGSGERVEGLWLILFYVGSIIRSIPESIPSGTAVFLVVFLSSLLCRRRGAPKLISAAIGAALGAITAGTVMGVMFGSGVALGYIVSGAGAGAVAALLLSFEHHPTETIVSPHP